ncbi:MAG TPA: hypothetical protein VMR54_06515 [Thermoanaerobaculia bacterium]|nr:hypothetical protein [Thermoanaerobaculia bacterium]
MKRSLVILAAALLVASAVPVSAQNPAYTLEAILSGTFQGSTPGNNLLLSTQPFTADPDHPYDLFLTISGKYQEENVRLQGVLRLDHEGADVLLTYVPHFDLSVTAFSSNAANFTDREASSACTLNMRARGDGFAGETLGSSCALAIRGATSKWTIETEPGSIRLREAKTGETLRFKRISK